MHKDTTLRKSLLQEIASIAGKTVHELLTDKKMKYIFKLNI